MLTGDVLNVQGVRGGAVVGIAVDQVDRSPVPDRFVTQLCPVTCTEQSSTWEAAPFDWFHSETLSTIFPRMQYRKVTRHHSVFNFLHELLKITLKEGVRDDHPSVRL